MSCDLGASLAASTCVQALCVQQLRRFAFALLSPLSSVQAGTLVEEQKCLAMAHEASLHHGFWPTNASKLGIYAWC